MLDTSKTGLSVTVLVGENGAGKSRLLKDIAIRERGTRSVYAISNTVYDRFVHMRGIHRISANSGRYLPERILKSAISAASRDGLFRLRTIADTLNYCGYGTRIGLRIKFSRKEFNRLNYRLERESIPYILELVQRDRPHLWPNDTSIDELYAALSLILDERFGDRPGIAWLVFGESTLSSSQSDQAARIFAWEGALRSMDIIERVELFLDRGDGKAIALSEASSGQLTLIACLVFLSVTVTDRSVVLIDEPENSLHPRWQREYVERLLALVSLRQPTIIIATHAPIIVSGAQLIEGADVKIFRLSDKGLEPVSRALRPGEKTSLEETLYESFGTVTPANHFISEILSKEFAKLRAGTTTADAVAVVVNEMREGSFDQQQMTFLEGIIGLARTVEVQRNRFGDTSA